MIRREPSREPGGSTWTGFGFMQVYEGSDLTFDVPSIFSDLPYDMVVRYEQLPSQPETWKTATMQLIPIDGPAEVVASPDCVVNQTFEMSNEQRYVVLDKPLCLEEGKRYQIKLTFDQYDETNPDPKASIRIDSVNITKIIFPSWERLRASLEYVSRGFAIPSLLSAALTATANQKLVIQNKGPLGQSAGCTSEMYSSDASKLLQKE